MKKNKIFLLVYGTFFMNSDAINQNLLLLKQENPFSYNLGIKIIPSKNANTDVTVCCHGYGHNNQIVDVVNSFGMVPGTLIGFNFPDYNISPEIDHTKASYGSINEILPLLYVLKRCVIDLKLPKINLYGFSAGGGAIVNTLATLNQSTYDSNLIKIGIVPEMKQAIISALKKGIIILDCPLKSCEEISDLRGNNREFEILAAHFKKNNMRPIDTVQGLKGLNLTMLLHFQKPDEILGNRDDALFIERLKQANSGITKVVIGHDGGHNTYHKSLWNEYRKLGEK